MKEFSKETIEIGGKEYTLFLNRAGIVAWEKFCKEYQKKTIEMQEKYKKVDKGPLFDIYFFRKHLRSVFHYMKTETF